MNTTTPKRMAGKGAYPIIVISLCACFLFYKYVLQIYPSVVTEQLMTEYHLSGAGLGNLAATFYYTYMITQLFVGVILDKYSTRWLTAGAILSCAVGVLIFSQSKSLVCAELSRGLMGIGVAFATVAYMKLAAAWFLPRQYAFIGGLLATAAMAGAVFGQAPLSLAIGAIGWRETLAITGYVGVGLAVLFAIIIRDAPPSTHEETKHHVTMQDILKVFKSKQNWLLALYSGLAFSPIAIFGGLWGTPFLQEAYLYSKTESAFMVSLVFMGLGLGSPLLGMLSDRLGNRHHVMLYSTLISFIAITLVLYCHPMSSWLVGTLLFTFGFALGAFVLAFTIGKELNSAALTATVIAMINASDPILDSITEPGIGKLLDLTWDGKLVNGVPYFSLHNYHIALSILPIYLAIATALLLWVKHDKAA
jgi:sugar phosphate permease